MNHPIGLKLFDYDYQEIEIKIEMDTKLNAKQEEALARIQNGSNIFLTGAAGTGKSFVIRKVIEWAISLKNSRLCFLG